jgi:hypothetical protein
MPHRPSPRRRVVGHAGAQADCADLHVVEMDKPAISIMVEVAAAGEMTGHGADQKRRGEPKRKSSIPWGSRQCRATVDRSASSERVHSAAIGDEGGRKPRAARQLRRLTSSGFEHYCTSRARSRANSTSLIDPACFSRLSFSISSETLKPTTLLSSSRACRACCALRSAMPLP